MATVIANISMSLDGIVGGSDLSVTNPMGIGGMRLHECLFPPKGDFHKIVEGMFTNVGAVLMGRVMFDLGEASWGKNPPYHMPVFVLTHRSKEPLVKEGGTTFLFATGGVEKTLKQAKEAAGNKDVLIVGGAHIIQAYLRAGLLDELRIHLDHVLLGKGLRLFDTLDRTIELEEISVTEGPGVTHFRLRVVKEQTATFSSNLEVK
jgi:dihydrofolate reductase